jgi:hypothetical protein
MKKAGLIILAIGLLISLFNGFKYATQKKAVEVEELEITADKKTTASWPSIVGIAIMTAGGIIFILGGKER